MTYKSKIVVLDNYDSFTYNLVHYIEDIVKVKVKVVRNDDCSLPYFNQFDTIFLSPGPGLPEQAGIMQDVINEYSPNKNIFGVCLGMQGIALNFGAHLINLSKVHHGVATKMSVIDRNEVLYKNIKDEFYAGRYHSWIVDRTSIPKELSITSVDENSNIMSLKHVKYNVHGVQFHPESVLSPEGKTIISNFLKYYT